MYNFIYNAKKYFGHGSAILNSAIICMIATVLISCEKALEEQPKSIAVETFYNTYDEAQTAVTAIYFPIGNFIHNGEIGLNSVLGEMTYGRGSWAAMNTYDGLNDTWKSRTEGRWSDQYLAIRNANIVIANLPNADALSNEEKNELLGEARFLRAFSYFQLARNWGGVPLRTEENILEIEVPRSSLTEILDFIEQDLLFAESNLPQAPRINGAPSVWSAKTMLADVYLHTEQYQESRDLAEEVFLSGPYSLVPVTTTEGFQQIFGPDVVTSTEEVFYSKYSHVANQGNVWPNLLAHPATDLFNGFGVYGVYSLSTNLAYLEWDDNDLRKGQWFPWDIGVGENTMLSMKFIDRESPGAGGGANPVTWYRYADLLFIFAEADAMVNNGPTSNGMEALNQIHRRAYGYDPLTTSPVDFSIGDFDLNSFLDLILKERGYEFDVEGKRWLDLKRSGKAEEIIATYLGEDVSESTYLWPIPVNEFNFNPALDPATDQNPGY
jgi:hypothetical protein